MLRPIRFLVLALAVAGLSACGAPRGGGGSTTVGADGALTIEMDEYVFEPQDIDSPNGRLRVRVLNRGSLAHNWRVIREGEELAGTETFQGGGERTIRLKLKPGTYKLTCTVGNHDDLGMRGVLRVGRGR